MLLLPLSIFFWAVKASSVATGNSTQELTFSQITPSTNLTWYPCNATFFCAMLDVPLDYTKPNGARAAVPLIKIAAETNSTEPYQGMFLVNPGGPGNTGAGFVLFQGNSFLLPVIGPNWDIVAFDPRGVGASVPLADCQTGAPSSNFRRRAFGLEGPELTDASYWDGVNGTFAEAQELGAACNATIGGEDDAGPHMSTVVVARDMISIIDAFAATDQGKALNSSSSNSSLLNYWGLSYGTQIGHTFASMFPDRIGRVVMDGVIDPEDYVSGAFLDNIYWNDAIMNTFFTYCNLAGPSACPFYTGSTPNDIYLRFQNIFDQLNAPFALAQNWTNATDIESALGITKSAIQATLYNPALLFHTLALRLVAYETVLQNFTLENIEAASVIGEVPPYETDLIEWEAGITCSDILSEYGQTFDDLKNSIQTLENQSFIAGEFWVSAKIFCTGWPIIAAERYAGPFGAATKNPMLFVSNTLDPATPIQNGQKWVLEYAGSELLTIDALGHSSLDTNNTCGFAKIASFIQNGTLPGSDSFCRNEAGPFGITIANLSTIIQVPTSVGGSNSSANGTIIFMGDAAQVGFGVWSFAAALVVGVLVAL